MSSTTTTDSNNSSTTAAADSTSTEPVASDVAVADLASESSAAAAADSPCTTAADAVDNLAASVADKLLIADTSSDATTSSAASPIASADTYKLTYFNYPGIAEPIRWIFAYAQIPFEDERLEWDDKWTYEIKPTCPWEMLPFLTVTVGAEDDGWKLSQSVAICRYLGNKFGLCGQNERELAKCDELADSIGDLHEQWIKIFVEPDYVEKEKIGQVFVDMLINYYNEFSKILDQNGGEWFVGSRLTWTDLYIAFYLNHFDAEKTILITYPFLYKFKKQIFKLPAIKQWLAAHRTKKTLSF